MPAVPLPDPPLGDGTVALRPFHEQDAPAITAAVQDPDIPRWTVVPSPYSERDAREFIARVEPDRRAGIELSLAIVDAADGRLLGACGLTRLDWADRKAEIGYWVAREARGRSVGTRATVLLSRWALQELGLQRLELFANPDNEPSQRPGGASGLRAGGPASLIPGAQGRAR